MFVWVPIIMRNGSIWSVLILEITCVIVMLNVRKSMSTAYLLILAKQGCIYGHFTKSAYWFGRGKLIFTPPVLICIFINMNCILDVANWINRQHLLKMWKLMCFFLCCFDSFVFDFFMGNDCELVTNLKSPTVTQDRIKNIIVSLWQTPRDLSWKPTPWPPLACAPL